MGDRWRFIDAGAQTPAEAMGRMPVLGRAVRKGADPILLTSIWGQTHVNVGWFDDVDATLDLAACERLGVAVIRRPVFGGGTAFYQEGCAAMSTWIVAKDHFPSLDVALTHFQPVFLDALSRVGLGEVRFEGSSDLRWHGRKLGALVGQDAGGCDAIGSFINLARPDVDLYLKVARIPDDKFADKVVKDLREYVVPASEIAGHPVSYADFRAALCAAVVDAGDEVYDAPLTEQEMAGIEQIGTMIASDDFIRRTSSVRFTAAAPAGSSVGFGNHKGRKLVRAGVAVDSAGVVVAAMMAGDMHVAPASTMDDVAAALVGARVADEADLRARIAAVFEGPDVSQADESIGVTTDDLLTAVRKAIAEAVVPTGSG